MAPNAEYYQYSRGNLVKFLPEKYSKILEIGCGEGNFWSHLEANPNLEIWGVEPNQSAAIIARRKAHQLYECTFEECCNGLPNNYFDLVICNDVIEHMPDHDWFLQQIQPKMTHDGFLVGSLPNVRYYPTLRNLLFAKDWPYEDGGVLDRTHLRFFTAKSMQRTFDNNGFNIEMFEGINSPGRFKFFLLFLNILLLGTALDTRFQQYGFRLSKK